MDNRVVVVAAGVLLALSILWLLATLAFTHLRFNAFHRREGIAYPRMGLRGWAGFYGRTVIAAAKITGWWWRARLADGLREPPGAGNASPVLCVHGFHMSGSCMWGFRRAFEERGLPTRAVTLGLPYRSVDRYARKLEAVLRELCARFPDRPVDAVAHSMGGLVLRRVLARSPELAARVGRVVTLGTPHHGTAFLRWLRSGPIYRMMGRDAPFLRALPPFAESAPRAEVTTIGSRHDLIVYPADTTHLAGAAQVTVTGIGHLGLLTDRRIHQRVTEILDADRAAG